MRISMPCARDQDLRRIAEHVGQLRLRSRRRRIDRAWSWLVQSAPRRRAGRLPIFGRGSPRKSWPSGGGRCPVANSARYRPAPE